MDIETKFKYLKRHIDSIAEHDDAPIEEVEAALNAAKDEIDDALADAYTRRAEAAKTADEE